MRGVFILYFLLIGMSFQKPCENFFSIEGFSSQLKSYKMSFSFCPIKRGDKSVVTHVDYLSKNTKTVYLDIKRYRETKSAITKLKDEVKKTQKVENQKCKHVSSLIFSRAEGKSFDLCESSQDYFLIKKAHEIIREIYYSN